MMHETYAINFCKSEITVKYSDVDLMQVVHNAKYFEFFEVGRLDFIEKFICPYEEMVNKLRIQIPVVANSAKYFKPAFYNDKLALMTFLESLTDRRLVFKYQLLKGDALIAEGYSEHAFILDGVLKAVPAPKVFAEKLGHLLA
jgi:acyl-CoA thioester hydrolase